ncbi:MAG: hypothetical protein R2682_00615 [Pyrinomonadaceae bacterium]
MSQPGIMRSTAIYLTLAIALGAVLFIAGFLALTKDRETAGGQSQSGDVPVSICNIIDDPGQFANRVIRIRTTVSALFSADLYAGDEGCVTAHPLVDVRFSQPAIERICSSGDPQSITACHALTVDLYEKRSDFAIKGVFAGTVESYVPSHKAFTHNGDRFRLTVTSVASIEEVTAPATFRLK